MIQYLSTYNAKNNLVSNHAVYFFIYDFIKIIMQRYICQNHLSFLKVNADHLIKYYVKYN